MRELIAFCAGVMLGCTAGFFVGAYVLVEAIKTAL